MISVELAGGLGNQLFQICNGIALSKKYNDDLSFPNYQENIDIIKNQHSANASEYSSTIFKNLSNLNVVTENPIVHDQLQFNFYDIELDGKNNYIKGYYQSEKFFLNYENNIKEYFRINEFIDSNILNNKNACTHFRRGDYIHQQHNHPILPKHYYDQAIKHIDYDRLFVISNDIEWCKNNLDYKNIEYVDEKDYRCLYLMSQCRYHIIANSSFSWWGAKFAEWFGGPEKIIAPNIWFGVNLRHLDIRDVVPDRWEKFIC